MYVRRLGVAAAVAEEKNVRRRTAGERNALVEDFAVAMFRPNDSLSRARISITILGRFAVFRATRRRHRRRRGKPAG